MIWERTDLLVCDTSTQIDGEWVPARPINYKYRSIQQKIKECYLLWKGEVDAFRWPKNQ